MPIGRFFHDYRNGNNSITPWLILLFGSLAVFVAAYSLPRYLHEGGSYDPYEVPGGLPELLGKRVDLPFTDSQGYPIPKEGARYVVTLACSSCSLRSGNDSFLDAASVKPVVIVLSEGLNSVPKRIRGKPGQFLLVCQATGRTVPLLMLDKAPQAAFVQNGLVSAVPTEGQTFHDFCSTRRPQ